MSRNLDFLATPEMRRAILLAEIAGLLHNIGKLDPNAPMLGQTRDELKAHHLYIPNYSFNRFAAPDLTLITKDSALKMILEETFTAKNELSALWDSHIDPQEIESAKPKEVTGESWRTRVLAAIWRFKQFLNNNGPLYRCLVDERENIVEEAQQRLAKLDLAIEEAKRHNQGAVINELHNQRAKQSRELESLALGTKLYSHEQNAQRNLEEQFRQFTLWEGAEKWPLTELLTLFWDDFFWKPDLQTDKEADYKRISLLAHWFTQGFRLPALLILSHGEISGSEKKDTQPYTPTRHELRTATAFGYDHAELDVWSFQSHRFELIEAALSACADPVGQRRAFIGKAREILQRGLGDTQWPINEIDLWDYASAIAALFKSGAARAVLDETVPTVDAMRWRFLSVRFDGLGYLSRAHHVTDLLGRRESLNVALAAVKTLLEETYSLGNEVYRDENGIVFVVPGWENGCSTLDLQDKTGTTLQTLIAAAFRRAARPKSEVDQALPPLDGELEPAIHEGNSLRGKKLQLGDYLKGQASPFAGEPDSIARWWTGDQAHNREICTVCGVRPVGYRPAGENFPGWVNARKANERHVCCVCLHRRGRRAQQWIAQDNGATIWADEVVDENGRFALFVGRFELTGWLDGALIETMQKPVSFARVQRVWETTRHFWQEAEKLLIPDTLRKKENPGSRFRLQIVPHHQDRLAQTLGDYHAYALEIGGQRMSVIWVPVKTKDGDKGHLLTTENLAALARRWNIKREKDDTPLTALQKRLEAYTDKPWAIYQPSGYNEPAQKIALEVELDYALGSDKSYTPHIPLLTEPAMFMALVPANKVLAVARAVKQKYEREMSKVQDRLPLHLGAVIAPRHTPLRAVLDAGRAMLDRPSTWEAWMVNTEPKKHETPPDGLEADGNFARWWEVPLEKDGATLTLRVAGCMGDGETEDIWHTHFLLREPSTGSFKPREHVRHVSKLTTGTRVFLAPSTFDFEYLDTTARRFEIAYDKETGRRRGRPTRPYRLDEVKTLQTVWNLVSKRLSNSQWMALDSLIEAKRMAWNEPRGAGVAYSETFTRFVTDALRNAEWRWSSVTQEKTKTQEEKRETHRGWCAFTLEERDLLEYAALHGVLRDVIDLYHEALKMDPNPKEARA